MKREGNLVDADPGDASVLIRLHLRWESTTTAVMRSGAGPAMAHVMRHPDGEWQLAFAVDRGNGRRQRHFVSVDPDAVRDDRWHLQRLGPGVWDVPQSIFVEGQLHAFVTLVEVPNPAPWERRDG